MRGDNQRRVALPGLFPRHRTLRWHDDDPPLCVCVCRALASGRRAEPRGGVFVKYMCTYFEVVGGERGSPGVLGTA
eukprot:scaffold47778_cov51-Phaeocystis_antarctica.AAC.2